MLCSYPKPAAALLLLMYCACIQIFYKQ